MMTHSIVTGVLAIGVVLLMLSLIRHRRLDDLLNRFGSTTAVRLKRYLQWSRVLIWLFLSGYAGTIWVVWWEAGLLGELVVAVIFLFGAAFVLLTLGMQSLMIATLRNQTEAATEASSVLDQERRTLIETNRQLRQEIEARQALAEERRRMVRELRQAQKMETLGMLAGGVAHDLNNVLSGVINYPELLLMDLPAKSPLVERIRKIKRSGQRAAAIVSDLLTIAREGISGYTIVNLNEVITEYLVSPEFEVMLRTHPGIQVDENLTTRLDPVQGSDVHLTKILMNLITNAAEAMAGGGRLTVATANVVLVQPIDGYETIPAGSYVMVTVSDTGSGMTPAEQSKIFEPFFTKKVMGRSGTGLGMAVVWSAVKDHGGYVDLASEPDSGTRISVYFPKSDYQQSKTLAPSPTEIDRFRADGERILVVDDVAEQLEIVASMLDILGYQVETASSGERALAFLESDAVDLVVLDMLMPPGIDGLETYRRILHRRPGQKALLVSGYVPQDKIQEAQRLGAGPYLRKPYTFNALAAAVRQELDRGKHVSVVDPMA